MLRAQMRVQIWPPLAASSVTVTTIGTPVSAPVGSGPPISARELRQPPAGAAEARLLDRADIDDGLAVGEALGEAPPDRQRQPAPRLVGQQIVEAAVVEQDSVRGGRCGKPW